MNAKLKVSHRTELVNVPERILKYIRKVMILDNPEFIQAEKYGRYAGHLDEHIYLYEDIPGGVAFPRGWTRQCLELLRKNGIETQIQDHRRSLSPVELSFRGRLRGYQQRAVRDILQRDFGVCSADTGSGKTVIALAIICKRGQPTLILVHTKELLHQWAERVRSFLDIEPGLIGDGKFDIQPVTVAIVNTARKHLEELPEHFGQIVVDECHRVPSSMFIETVQAFDSKYMVGLSATTYRRDGLDKLIYYALGDRAHKVDSEQLRQEGAVLAPQVYRRETSFRYAYSEDYQAMLTALTEDRRRNLQIAEDVIDLAGNRPGTVLVVSDRVAHCQALAELIEPAGHRVKILTGRTPREERAQIVADVQAGEVDVLVSTLQLLGEGFDCPGLSSLVLATPVRFKGRLTQVVGRILRPADGKRPVVFDYIDSRVGVLRAQARSRERALDEVSA